jgi:hypothetical protein
MDEAWAEDGDLHGCNNGTAMAEDGSGHEKAGAEDDDIFFFNF